MIIIDVETLPTSQPVTDFIGEVDAPANYKDPEKISEYKAREALKVWKKTSTDPLCAQLLVVGLHDGTSAAQFVAEAGHDQDGRPCLDARPALEAAWRWVGQRYQDQGPNAPKPVWVGHNSLRFDFRVVGLRALALGLDDLARSILPPKYQGPHHKDTALALGDQFISLDKAAKFFGIKRNKIVPGDEVADAFARGRLDDILASNLDDLTTTLQVAQFARRGGLL